MLFSVLWRCRKHLDAVRAHAQTLSSVPNVSLSWQLNTRVLQSFMLFTGLESRKVHTSKKTKGNRNGHIQTKANPNWIPRSHHGLERRKHSRRNITAVRLEILKLLSAVNNERQKRNPYASYDLRLIKELHAKGWWIIACPHNLFTPLIISTSLPCSSIITSVVLV